MKNHQKKKRLGAAAVEFAIVAPIFFLVVFASIEFASIHITQCAMENAAFEGARRGIVPGATAETCRLHAEDLLTAAGINEFTVTVEPATIDALSNSIKVDVDVPMSAANKFGLSAFLNGQSIKKAIELPREDHSDTNAMAVSQSPMNAQTPLQSPLQAPVQSPTQSSIQSMLQSMFPTLF